MFLRDAMREKISRESSEHPSLGTRRYSLGGDGDDEILEMGPRDTLQESNQSG